MTALPWPSDVYLPIITPSRPYFAFTVNGRTYGKTSRFGLIARGDSFFVVPLYSSGGKLYYDTGRRVKTTETLLGGAAGPVPPNVGGTAMALYPNVYEVRNSSVSSFNKKTSQPFNNIRNLNSNINFGNQGISSQQSSGFLVGYYSVFNKGSTLMRNPEEMRLAMQRIKDALTREFNPGFSLSSAASSFNARLGVLLTRAGFPAVKIKEFLTGRSLGVIRPGSGSEDTGGSTPGGSLEQRIVVRAPFGYIKPAEKGTENRPQIAQIYPVENTTLPISTPSPASSSQAYATERFVFPYIPNNIQYQGSGSEWVEIPRGSDFPIVEWSRWQLLKISMEFLIANQRTEDIATGTKVPDGIFTNVYDQIETLRRMAQRPYPVSVFGMDEFFTISMRRAQLTGKPLEFVITDFSWTATRRTIGTDPSNIAVATCRMTLQEIPIEETNIVKFNIPVLAPKKTPKKPSGNNEKPDPGTGLIADITPEDPSTFSTNKAAYMPTSTTQRSVIAQTGSNGEASNGLS